MPQLIWTMLKGLNVTKKKNNFQTFLHQHTASLYFCIRHILTKDLNHLLPVMNHSLNIKIIILKIGPQG